MAVQFHRTHFAVFIFGGGTKRACQQRGTKLRV
jgi:hypothetical protein